MILTWEVYRQDVWEDVEEPGPGWEPFAATVDLEHNGLRESLGGRCDLVGEVVWWRRRVWSEEGSEDE